MINIVPYQTDWPDRFRVLGEQLRVVLGDFALRIDHIGSTSVPDLAAKDIIDIQVTTSALTTDIIGLLVGIGYSHVPSITGDHIPPGASDIVSNWEKWFFKQGDNPRRVNLHIRLAGRPNQRYALLFRDYLRANVRTAVAYAQVKCALARYHSLDETAYYDIKDPACDIIFEGAEAWAQTTSWHMGLSDC